MFSGLKVYTATFAASLQAKFEYKLDFFIGMLTSTMLQLSALGLLYVVFHQTTNLQGWSQVQVLLLFGLTAMALGGSELFFNHIWMVPTYIVMGDLDRLIVYPVRSLPFLLISRPEMHSFGNLVTGSTFIIYALVKLRLPWQDWALMPFWALCGCLIYTSMLVVFCSLSFRFIGPYGYSLMIPHTLLQATRYPVNIYPAWVHYGLLFLLPYGAFNYMPAGWALGKILSPWTLAITPLATIACMVAAQLCWNWGLKQYQSAGS